CRGAATVRRFDPRRWDDRRAVVGPLLSGLREDDPAQRTCLRGISTPATIALHWNKTLFREAGLDPERPPRTLAEFDDFARRLTKHDPKTGEITQAGFLPQEPGWWPWAFCRWFGGELFDGHAVTLNTDPRNLAAMKWVEKY